MEQEIKVNVKKMMAKLSKLQADMDYVKEHIEDTTLTDDDLKSIKESRKDLKEGKTTSLEDLKKELEM